jgi:hypothetical protein
VAAALWPVDGPENNVSALFFSWVAWRGVAPPTMPMQGHGQNGVTWVGIGSPRASQLPGPALAWRQSGQGLRRRAGRFRGEPVTRGVLGSATGPLPYR